MAKPIQTTIQTEDKHSISWSALILWPFVIVLLYVFSAGPFLMMADKHNITGNSKLWEIYLPLNWAYVATPLHKPLGLYFHLWSERFDKNGDPKKFMID